MNFRDVVANRGNQRAVELSGGTFSVAILANRGVL